jgi:hypothetical protein
MPRRKSVGAVIIAAIVTAAGIVTMAGTIAAIGTIVTTGTAAITGTDVASADNGAFTKTVKCPRHDLAANPKSS